MKRTTTGDCDINLWGTDDEAAVNAALDECPMLNYAAMTLHYSKYRVQGRSILAAKALIDVLRPKPPSEAIDPTTLISLLTGELEIEARTITSLRALLPTAVRNLHRQATLRGNLHHVRIGFSAWLKATGERFEVTFSHKNAVPESWHATRLFYPIEIRVQVFTRPDANGISSLRDVSEATIQIDEEFNHDQVREWIRRSIRGLMIRRIGIPGDYLQESSDDHEASH